MKTRPLGDTLDDGSVQLSFTLPIDNLDIGRVAAIEICMKMGLSEARVAHAEMIGSGFMFFVLYGRFTQWIETEKLSVLRPTIPEWTREEINEKVRSLICQELIIVGAATGTDAHTVGLDSILNAKGYGGIPGLESYSSFRVYNLGSQVSNDDLVEAACRLNAHVILVSQVVTQKEVHLRNLTALIDLLEAKTKRDDFILIIGGPRIDHGLALELGFDAGFGPGTTPDQVARCIVHLLKARHSII